MTIPQSDPISPPDESKKRSTLKWIQWLVVVLLLAALVVFAFYKGDELYEALTVEWSKAHLSFDQFGYGYFFAGLVIFFLSVLTTFFRWRVLVHALGISFSRLDALRLGFMGYVTSMFLPGSTMGDAVKAWFILKENPGKRLSAVASIVVDRLVGLYSLFLLAGIVGLLNLQLLWAEDQEGITQLRAALLVIWGVGLGGLVAYLLFAFLPLEGKGYHLRIHNIRLVGRIISRLITALAPYRRHPLAVLISVLIGMLGHVGFVLSYYLASMALPGPGPTPTWQVHFLIIPFFMVFQAVPLSPGGNLVVGDALLGGLYVMVGGLLTKGILASLFQRLITWIVALVGLIWYVPLHRRMLAAQRSGAATTG